MPEEVSWAGLITDILKHIYNNIPPDPYHFMSLRRVCKNWRGRDFLRKPPPKFPWLLECKRGLLLGSVGNCLQRRLRYYSLATDETYNIFVPEPLQGKIFYGPGHGYLLLSCAQQLTLLNPLTGDVISLPQLRHPFRTLRPVCGGLDPLQNWHLLLGFSPSTHVWECEAAIYHHNKDNWTYAADCSRNTCCWDGRLYNSKGNHYTKVYDATSRDTLDANGIKPPEEDLAGVVVTYLVESGGDILRISCFLDLSSESIQIEDSKFQIHNSNLGKMKTKTLGSMSNIGECILFLDVANGFSLMAPDGIKGNCIYFLTHGNDNIRPYRYDMGTSTVERVPCPFNRCTWFIPSLE